MKREELKELLEEAFEKGKNDLEERNFKIWMESIIGYPNEKREF